MSKLDILEPKKETTNYRLTVQHYKCNNPM